MGQTACLLWRITLHVLGVTDLMPVITPLAMLVAMKAQLQPLSNLSSCCLTGGCTGTSDEPGSAEALWQLCREQNHNHLHQPAQTKGERHTHVNF